MAQTVIFTGDDVAVPITLKVDGTARAVASGSTVKAILLKGTTKVAPSTFWTCLSSDSGVGPTGATVAADWTNGVVLVKMAAADTSGIATTQRPLQFEIQVEKDSLKQTFRTSLDDAIILQKDLIS